MNADDVNFIGYSGENLSCNAFAYCENNPVNDSDPSGYGPVGSIIGGILGFGLGKLLLPKVANILKLQGKARKAFLALGVVAITGLGHLLDIMSVKLFLLFTKLVGHSPVKLTKLLHKVYQN